MKTSVITGMSLVAILTALCGYPAAASEEPCRGERRLCPALITPEVVVVTMQTQMALEGVCGFNAHGCAQLHAGFTRCTIYLGPRAKSVTRLHEENHCRGWDHAGHGRRAHRKPWSPFAVVERWLLKKE